MDVNLIGAFSKKSSERGYIYFLWIIEGIDTFISCSCDVSNMAVFWSK